MQVCRKWCGCINKLHVVINIRVGNFYGLVLYLFIYLVFKYQGFKREKALVITFIRRAQYVGRGSAGGGARVAW